MEMPPEQRFDGAFIGIADPVYNAADNRYTGRKWRTESVLTRLPNTDREVKSCARAWGAPSTRVLTGMDANSSAVESALQTNPSIIHFATHVVPGPGDYGSGLIALSLNRKGALGVLGPRQILARPVTADLVVLDGCDSAQGSALPAAGLMGLTRAWIGAGAHAVLATLWDIPDDAQSALPAFYRRLREHEELGPAAALRAAQLDVLAANPNGSPAAWAGYFLLARR
jgi:CHAT domain-containing protein